jgi:YHS domain-containing protein
MRHRLDVSYTAEYRQKYYQLSSERYLRKFLADPELYVGAVLPSELPFRVPYNEAQRLTDANAQLGGYCPVTLHRGLAKGKVDMIKGKASCAVWYAGRLFLLADGAAVAAFLARPARFAQQPAPAQLPPRIEPTSADKLLEIGETLAFMDQAVSRTLATAMTTTGQRRLKYPGLSIGETTLLYFAALLKAGNTRYPAEEQLRFQQQLAAFEAACALTPSLALVYKPNVVVASRALVRSGAKATAQLEAAYDGLGKDLRERTQAGRLASHFDQYIF